MRTLTWPEATRLVRDHDREREHLEDVWFRTELCRPRTVAFARLFAGIVGPGPVLWWVTESGIWPSSENPHLFAALRLAGGEARPLHEAPGHLFGSDETDALTSYLQVAILAGWGGIALGLENGGRFILSHDEWGLLCAPSGAILPRDLLTSYGLSLADVEPIASLTALGLTADGEVMRNYEPEPQP